MQGLMVTPALQLQVYGVLRNLGVAMRISLR